MSVTNKWGLTQVNINKCNYTWTINNFSYLLKRTEEELESPCFTISNGNAVEPRWCLRLYPKGINESFKDYLSLYLYRKSGSDCKIEGRYELSLLNDRKEKFVHECEECHYNKNYSSWGFPAFVKYELITDKANGLLVDDSLTFRCEIALIVGNINVSSDDYKSTDPPVRADKLENLSVDFEKMFLDERFCDVRLIAPCGKELCAHKCILSARSPIFSAMFEHEMVEKKLAAVEIVDVEHDVLRELLRYLYAEKVENVKMIADKLLSAADKYGIEGLKEMCEKVLCDNISVDNVCDILVLSDRHNIRHLKARALNFVKAHIKDVIGSEGFASIAQVDVLADIIRTMIL